METVKQFLIRVTLEHQEERLAQFRKYNAPMVIIKKMEEKVQLLRDDVFKPSGDKDALADNFLTAEQKTGRGGKKYLSINEGAICYFPLAAYGPYIKRNA